MTGLIWFVQLVHYPLMASVGAGRFVRYETIHQRRTSWIVGPMMSVELVTGVALVVIRPEMLPAALAWLNLGLLLVLWLSTAGVQMPLHRQLGKGLDARIVRRLVQTNWLRTAAWTARSALLIGVMIDTNAGSLMR